MEAGPSTGQIRRPKPRATDIANVYAHLQFMKDATDEQIEELKADFDRLESNHDVQKKFVVKKLSNVEEQVQAAVEQSQSAKEQSATAMERSQSATEQSQAAMEQSAALQQQLDQVRQQTSDMHHSLSAIHNHSSELTKGLGMMMDKFQKLSFDLPNLVDHWVKSQPPPNGNFITGAQLHQGAWDLGQFPQLPHLSNLIPLLQQAAPFPQPDLAAHRPWAVPDEAGPSQVVDSASTMFTKYVNSQGSATGRAEVEEAGGDMSGDGGVSGAEAEPDDDVDMDGDKSGDAKSGEEDKIEDDEDQGLWGTVSDISEEILSQLTSLPPSPSPIQSQHLDSNSPEIIEVGTVSPPSGLLVGSSSNPSRSRPNTRSRSRPRQVADSSGKKSKSGRVQGK